MASVTWGVHFALSEQRMSKKSKENPGVMPRAVRIARAARLYRLLQLLRQGPQTRETLTRRLGRDVRSFYRDLDLLRASGMKLPLRDGRYHLRETVRGAVARLPFPDPILTLGEAKELAKGHTPAHRKLREQIERIVKAQRRKAR
jgi:predicted DNA-binding transcriptional regulator YafY